MTTNGEWLDYLAHNAPDELSAWFDAEHVETEERALDGGTEPENEDSRERLEADVRKIADAYNMDTQRHGTERFADELYYSIIHLLERRAAITERECRKPNWSYCETCEALEKLTAERDKLQEQLRIGWECECRLQAERERYRSKFGKCLDYADAIHALMDDEGMA